MTRRGRARLLLLFAASAVVALLAFGFFPQEHLRRLAEQQLARGIAGSARIGRLHVVPARLSAELTDVSLQARGMLFEAARIRIVGTRGLLSGSLALDSLEIDSPQLRVPASDGERAAQAGPLPQIWVRELRVSNASLRYTDPALGGDIALGPVQVSGAIGSGALELSGAGIWERTRPLHITALAAEIVVSSSLDADVTFLRAEARQSRLGARGGLVKAGSFAPDLQVEGDVDLAELSSLAEGLDLGGRVRLAGRVTGSAGAVHVAGTAEGSSLTAQGWPIERAEARIDGKHVEARARATGLDLARLGREAGVAAPLAGAASLDISVKGELGATLETRASADARLTGGGLSLGLHATADGGVEIASRSVDLAWTLTADGTASDAGSERPRLDALRAEATGSARGALPPEIEATVAGTLELAPLLQGLSGHLAFGFEGKGPIRRLSGTGRARAEGVAWEDVAVGPVALDLRAAAGAASVSLAAPEWGLSGHAQIPASSGEPISASFTLTDLPLGRLGQRLPEAIPRDRTLSGSARFAIPIKAPHPITLDAVALETRGVSLQASGRFGLEESDPLDLTLRLRSNLAELPAPPGWSAAGELEGDVALSGTRARPHATGAIQARGLSLLGPKLAPLHLESLRLEMADDAVLLPATTAEFADGSLTLSGRAPLLPLLVRDRAKHQGAARLHVEWNGLSAAALVAQLYPQAATPVEASLSGRAELAGDLDSMESLRGTALFDGGPVRIQDLSFDLAPSALVLEAGRLSTEEFTVRTAGGEFTLAGAVNVSQRTLDVSGTGAVDLRALSPFVGTASVQGTAEMAVRVGGSFEAPRPSGTVTLSGGSLRFRDIPEVLTDISGRLALEGEAMRLLEGRARLGGGEVQASGQARMVGRELADVSATLTGRGMALRYPAGLRSRVDADLALAGRWGALRLAGVVTNRSAVFDLDTRQAASGSAAAMAPSPALRGISLDVRLVIDNPVLIRDELARLDVGGALLLRGDLETPAPFGRLDISPGGKIYVRGRDFSVESGRLAYAGTWNPSVALRATRRIRDLENGTDHDVTLAADGPLESVRPTLRTRDLSDGQTAALVASGRASGASLGLGAHLAGEQIASLLAGKLSQKAGLDEVSVQPELLARETEPGARFTFGKQISTAVSLIYSLGLAGPEQRFAQIEVQPRRSVSLKAQRTDDGIFTLAAGQKLRLGGGRRSEPSAVDDRVRLAGVHFEGDTSLAKELRLADAVRAKPGRRVSPWELQEDGDRVRERLVEERYIEARVGARMEGDEAVFLLRAGPRFAWRVQGMRDPPDLGDIVRRALFEEEALENGRARVLETVASRGHLRAQVEATSLVGDGTRTLVFSVETGPRLVAEVTFPGASVLSDSALLKAAGGAAALLREPQHATERIRGAYRGRQHLAVVVGPPSVRETGPGRLGISVPVNEGAAARVASVRVEGATRPEEELLRAAALPPGSPFTTEALSEAVERVRDDYFAQGYASVRVSAEQTTGGADVEVVIRVAEGHRAVVGAVEIRGLGRTRESLVRRRLGLTPGAPLDPRRLAAAERRLSDIGIFSLVVVTASDESPATVTVELEEDARVAAAYDLRWSDSSFTSSQATAQSDAELRNLLGRGVRAGARYRFGTDIREARGSLYAPSFRHGSITAVVFQLEEDFEATDIFTGEAFTNVQTERGALVQQALPLGRRWQTLFGYRFKRVLSTTFQEPIDIAALDLSILSDTRDNPLDSRSGRFLGASVELSPESLGSDLRFVKGFAQAFFNRPLTPSLSWAQSYRVGLAHGLGGQQLIPSERFNAGGPNSLRGFPTDSVGPRDVLGEAAGGNAVVVFNQELRYRHAATGVGAALFYDAGNVFASVRDLGLGLRHTLGGGIRWNSPLGLLRLDLGFPLARREGEEALQVHFSLGQSF